MTPRSQDQIARSPVLGITLRLEHLIFSKPVAFNCVLYILDKFVVEFKIFEVELNGKLLKIESK